MIDSNVSLVADDAGNDLSVDHGYLASSYHSEIISGFMLISSHLDRMASSKKTESYRIDYGGTDEEIMEDDFEYLMETREPKNISRLEKPATQIKPIVEATDDLNALLEEEENLVLAHRCK